MAIDATTDASPGTTPSISTAKANVAMLQHDRQEDVYQSYYEHRYEIALLGSRLRAHIDSSNAVIANMTEELTCLREKSEQGWKQQIVGSPDAPDQLQIQQANAVAATDGKQPSSSLIRARLSAHQGDKGFPSNRICPEFSDRIARLEKVVDMLCGRLDLVETSAAGRAQAAALHNEDVEISGVTLTMNRDTPEAAVQATPEATPVLESSQTYIKGGSLHNPFLTDSLVNAVCSHQGPGCSILWKTCKLVPHVPLRLRKWIAADAKPSSVLQKILTRDQHFDHQPRGIGISVSILGVDSLDLVRSYWTGTVQVLVKIPAGAIPHEMRCSADTHAAMRAVNSGDRSEAARQKVLDLLGRDVSDYGAGKRRGTELDAIPGMTDAERLMRFTMIGVVNWCRGPDTEKDYPVIAGDSGFRWFEGTDYLTATWTIESRWYNQPSLRSFPFDTHSLCAIFWIKAWSTAGITDGGRCYGLGNTFQEFDIYGISGDTQPLSGWNPYQCESNIVPNSARSGEFIVYGRFWARRKAFFFVTSVCVPTAIIVLLGACAVAVAEGRWINRTIAGSESPVSFLAALLLTMTATRFSYSDNLPVLGYLTMLDWYIQGNFFCLAAAACLITALDEQALQNLHATEIYIGLFAILNFIFFSVAWYVFRIPAEHSPRLSFPCSDAPGA